MPQAPVHDPTLTQILGILTGYEWQQPRTMTFDVGPELQAPDDGDGIAVESTETYRVADDAVFKVEGVDLWRRVLRSDEFFDLLDFIQSGGCSTCLDGGSRPNECIWASWDSGEGLQFDIYLNAGGEIQQLTQIHRP